MSLFFNSDNILASCQRTLTIGVIVAASVSVAACGKSQEPTLRGVTRTPAPSVANITLPDVTAGKPGRPFVMKAARGGLLIVYFGYTACPDVCPTTLADIKGAIAKLPPAQRKLVMPVMATNDPARDTPAVMNGYLSHFFRSWRALRSTSKTDFAKAERAFNASHKRGPANEYGSYEISHTAVTYAVNDQGLIVVEWPFGTSSAIMATDINQILTKQQANLQSKSAIQPTKPANLTENN